MLIVLLAVPSLTAFVMGMVCMLSLMLFSWWVYNKEQLLFDNFSTTRYCKRCGAKQRLKFDEHYDPQWVEAESHIVNSNCKCHSYAVKLTDDEN